MLLFVGLGNPGEQYAKNRHNIGFMVVDALAHHYKFSLWSKKFSSLIAEGFLEKEHVLLIKPQTFMNLSGEAVQKIMHFYKAPESALTVFHDEMSLSQGKLKIKKGGSHRGHNGILSINQNINNYYRRIGIGIGHPGAKELVTPHVLGNFTGAEEKWLHPLLESIAENAIALSLGNDESFLKATQNKNLMVS